MSASQPRETTLRCFRPRKVLLLSKLVSMTRNSHSALPFGCGRYVRQTRVRKPWCLAKARKRGFYSGTSPLWPLTSIFMLFRHVASTPPRYLKARTCSRSVVGKSCLSTQRLCGRYG